MSKNIRWDETQKQVMLDFMCAHPEFAAGRLMGPLGKQKEAGLWEKLTMMLNARGVGAWKTKEKWIRTWSDWKSNSKQKASEIQRYSTGTGGGVQCSKRLNDLEVRLLDLIGWTTVTGLTSIPEAGILINCPPSDGTDGSLAADSAVTQMADTIFFYQYGDTTEAPAQETVLIPEATALIPAPETVLSPLPTAGSSKRKDTPTSSGQAQRKRVRKATSKESPYAETVKSFEEFEEKRSTHFETIGSSLKDLAVSMKSIAETETRKVNALERIAAAKEAKIKLMMN